MSTTLNYETTLWQYVNGTAGKTPATACRTETVVSGGLRCRRTIVETDDYVDVIITAPYLEASCTGRYQRSGAGTPSPVSGTITVSGATYSMHMSGFTYSINDDQGGSPVSYTISSTTNYLSYAQISKTLTGFGKASSASDPLYVDGQGAEIFRRRYLKTRVERTVKITLTPSASSIAISPTSLSGTASFTQHSAGSLTALARGTNKTLSAKAFNVTIPAKAGFAVKVKVDGAWEEGELKAKVNGEWVDADAAYVKVNGAWMEIN